MAFGSVLIEDDHLIRMAHFLPCTKGVTTKVTTTLFFHIVYRLHGLPRLPISHRDTKASSGFWKAL
jgi:hypothetical protein